MRLLASALCLVMGWSILEAGSMVDAFKPYWPAGLALIGAGVYLWATSKAKRAK